MGLAISGLNAVETPAVTDVLEVEQSTGSAKATIQQIDDLVFSDTTDLDATILPIEGDIAAYDGSVLEPNAEPRWRVIPAAAYTAGVSSIVDDAQEGTSTITFNGGEAADGVYLKASDYFSVGDAVKGVNSFTYYGVCIAVDDTSVTIQGMRFSTGTGSLSSLSVGSKDMVKHIRMVANGTSYDSGVSYVAKGCQHRWVGATGYIAQVAFAHMTVASNLPSLILHNSGGGNVTGAEEIPAGASGTVYGDWVSGGFPSATAGIVDDGDLLRAYVSVAGGTPSDYLICSIMLVVP